MYIYNIYITFEPTSENAIYNIINNLENKNSTGKDEISNKLLKSINHIISKPLSVIINQSLVTGIFPNALKISQVIPLYKKYDQQYLSNCRPISLLPTISKVFERVLFTQIYDNFNINSLLCEEQLYYGVRSKHSTELATIKLVDQIINDMDNIKNIKNTCGGILDLSKAFDTLDFDILLYMGNYHGIRGTSLTLFQNYLSNREHYTHYENQDSDLLDIKIGIPQGSILGPLFFSIYIHDLVNASKKLSCLMYADDTTIYFNQEDFPKINRRTSINMELEKLCIWLKLNKLTLNVEKKLNTWSSANVEK